jgi:hypothetical protein
MKDAIPQMIRIGDIGDTLRVIKDRLDHLRSNIPSSDSIQLLQYDRPAGPNLAAYSIGQSDRSEDAFNYPLWVHNNRQNFALKVSCLSYIHPECTLTLLDFSFSFRS